MYLYIYILKYVLILIFIVIPIYVKKFNKLINMIREKVIDERVLHKKMYLF